MIEEILKQAVAEHASDIFLIPGMAYGFKLGGTIVHKGEEKIFQEEMNRLITELYHTAGERSMERVTSVSYTHLAVVLAAAALMTAGVSQLSRRTEEEGARNLVQAVRRASVQCYAIEGRYPPSVEYLEENYGIAIDLSLIHI